MLTPSTRRGFRITFTFDALIALALLIAPSTFAQGAPAANGLSGYVRDAGSHEPVVSARVDLISQSGMAAPVQYTNENGEFHFFIGDGDYHLRVSKIGYETQPQIAVSVVAGHSSEIEIDLVRDDSKSSDESGPASKISAHELSAPLNARNDYAKGKDLMAKKDYDGAIAAFQKATREFPDFYEAYAGMGVAQYMSGHAAEARASLQESIGLSKSKYPDAIFDLADVFNDVGNYSEAEPLAKQVIDLDVSSWHGYFERARALLGLKRYADAQENASKAIELDPGNGQAYVILTNIHIAMHDYPAAVRDIDGYLNLDSNSPTADAMRSTRAQLTKAIANMKKAKPQ